MMDDNTLSEHSEPVEFLNICLSDNLQPHPGVHPRETSSRPDPPEPLEELTWASDPFESTGRQDAAAGGSRAEPEGLGSGSSQGGPRQNPSSSTQVVFWAGILQAQMCVLDLEEELEKTEGLRAELRSCIPTAPAALPLSASSPAGPLDPGPPTSPPSGEDSSRSKAESQIQVSPREETPDSSPEWGAEEESLFFDNPLFLESPCSETSAPGERFSWGHPDSCADDGRPEGPQTLEPPLLLGRVPWGLGDEPDSGDSMAESSGHTTPPFPVPTYKPHSFSWAEPDSAQQAPAALPGWAGREVSRALGTHPELGLGHRTGLALWSLDPDTLHRLGPLGTLEKYDRRAGPARPLELWENGQMLPCPLSVRTITSSSGAWLGTWGWARMGVPEATPGAACSCPSSHCTLPPPNTHQSQPKLQESAAKAPLPPGGFCPSPSSLCLAFCYF